MERVKEERERESHLVQIMKPLLVERIIDGRENATTKVREERVINFLRSIELRRLICTPFSSITFNKYKICVK